MNGKLDDEDGVPTDGIASFTTRRSLQTRRSLDPHRRSSSSFAYLNGQGDREGLMRSFDAENGAFGLSDLRESERENSTSGKRNDSPAPANAAISPKEPIR